LLRSLLAEDAQQLAIVGHDVQRAIIALLHVANPLAQVRQQPFLASDLVAFHLQPYHFHADEAAHEDTALPLGKHGAVVDGHATGSDDGIPVVHRLFHACLLREACTDLPARIVDAVADDGPAIVGATLDQVEFVATSRTMFDRPDLAGGGIYGERLRVTM